jgi:predicted RNA binding protein YcfA (HicA-like mRNA interferase family)
MLATVKVRELIRMIEADGWRQVRQRGSHWQFKHPIKPGLVTIAGSPADDLAAGTLNSVLKQSGLKSCDT